MVTDGVPRAAQVDKAVSDFAAGEVRTRNPSNP
jgi:hypothetical protein